MVGNGGGRDCDPSRCSTTRSQGCRNSGGKEGSNYENYIKVQQNQSPRLRFIEIGRLMRSLGP